jgi:hypothetical protein
MHRFDRHCGVEPRSDGVPRRRRAKESGGRISARVRGLVDAIGIGFDRGCLRSTAVHTLDIKPVYLPACIRPDPPLPYDPDHAAGLEVGGTRGIRGPRIVRPPTPVPHRFINSRGQRPSGFWGSNHWPPIQCRAVDRQAISLAATSPNWQSLSPRRLCGSSSPYGGRQGWWKDRRSDVKHFGARLWQSFFRLNVNEHAAEVSCEEDASLWSHRRDCCCCPTMFWPPRSCHWRNSRIAQPALR